MYMLYIGKVNIIGWRGVEEFVLCPVRVPCLLAVGRAGIQCVTDSEQSIVCLSVVVIHYG